MRTGELLISPRVFLINIPVSFPFMEDPVSGRKIGRWGEEPSVNRERKSQTSMVLNLYQICKEPVNFRGNDFCGQAKFLGKFMT